MDYISKLVEFFRSASTWSVTKRILFIIAVIATLGFLLFGSLSCSSHRSFSVSVDKAEKVNVQYTDSIDANSPL